MKELKPILLVEDDQVDVMTVQRAFRQLHIVNQLAVASDGAQALTYLEQNVRHPPCMVLLDIRMPRMNGLEFLQVMKNDPRFRRIPTVVLTTSREERDRLQSFDLGVAGYMIKPVDYLQFIEIIRAIDLYWTISEMP